MERRKKIQSEMKKAKELQAKAKQKAATYLPLPCNLKHNEMKVFMPPDKKEYVSVVFCFGEFE